MRSLRHLCIAIPQGYLVGGGLHLLLLHQTIGAAARGRERQGSVVQDLQDELIPYLVYYLLALLIVFLVRVFVHAMTLGDHARESQASRLSIPLRQQLVTILLQPWAPGHRGALALHFLGAGLASGVNLWWVHTVAYEQWPHFLGYTLG